VFYPIHDQLAILPQVMFSCHTPGGFSLAVRLFSRGAMRGATVPPYLAHYFQRTIFWIWYLVLVLTLGPCCEEPRMCEYVAASQLGSSSLRVSKKRDKSNDLSLSLRGVHGDILRTRTGRLFLSWTIAGKVLISLLPIFNKDGQIVAHYPIRLEALRFVVYVSTRI